MAFAVFPDNTVLCNFAAVHRLSLLEDWLRGRGRWTEAVAYEAGRSERWWPDLASIRSGGWLGEPIELSDPVKVERVESIRRVVFGGLLSEPRKHLGEAQTCYLIIEDADYRESWWLSDDGDAVEYAQRRNIRTLRTIDVMRQIVTDGDLTSRAAFELLHEMSRVGRELVLPSRVEDL